MGSWRETIRNTLLGFTAGGAAGTWLASQKNLHAALEQGKTVVQQAATQHFLQPQAFDSQTGRPSFETVRQFHHDVKNQGYVVAQRRFYALLPKPKLVGLDRHSGLDALARGLGQPPFIEVLATRWQAGATPQSFDRVVVDAGYSIRPTWSHLSRIAGQAVSTSLAKSASLLGAASGAFWGIFCSDKPSTQ